MEIRKLDKDFYLQKTFIVARELIGKVLVRIKKKKIYSGIIVETEAYLGKSDPAAHSFRGKTKRNQAMFSEGGIAYVYFTYGNHYCFNVVTRGEGIGEAVLIRALEPAFGIGYMKKNRKRDDIYDLTSGPGKLTQAFEIDKNINRAKLDGKEIFIIENENGKYKVIRTPRIGITKNADKLLRYCAVNNPFVSMRKIKNKE